MSIIHGFHAVTARLRQPNSGVVEVYLDANRADARAKDLAALAGAQGVRVLSVDGARLDGMAGTRRHQGVAAQVAPRAKPAHLDDVLDNLSEPALLVVLDGVKDPHNLGACLRVADGMGAHAVIAPKDRAAPLNATAAKAASGAAETIPYLPVTNLARALRQIKERDIWIVGAAEDGPVELFSAKLAGAVCWAFGAEGEGMRRLTRDHCDQLLRIPLFGAVESLNVSVAAGICLAETRRQRLSVER